MPVQAIASAAADEPGTGPLSWAHPLAAVAARNCQKHSTTLPQLIGGVACSPCWDDALVADYLFAAEHGLPLALEVDPSYVDTVAVDRAVRGEALELTELERAEVRRRLGQIRDRRNRSYQYVCSRAAAARREVGR
ncbi:hypothetical protein [Catellatospora chokoriensis]|uniref:Uncharacterized protein n=1 Tax=Catellatospora chokoriensis TaxID=310353 RepID=A0A8J3NUL9_9ACTN|nr:hypothetical protein [Catellatospora chokoriensis]GIF91385.1 hypothetical protein Cch02nite_48290 [Catellatospora chokoriensis]